MTIMKREQNDKSALKFLLCFINYSHERLEGFFAFLCGFVPSVFQVTVIVLSSIQPFSRNSW
jgi:hypothetical protein